MDAVHNKRELQRAIAKAHLAKAIDRLEDGMSWAARTEITAAAWLVGELCPKPEDELRGLPLPPPAEPRAPQAPAEKRPWWRVW